MLNLIITKVELIASNDIIHGSINGVNGNTFSTKFRYYSNDDIFELFDGTIGGNLNEQISFDEIIGIGKPKLKEKVRQFLSTKMSPLQWYDV